MNRYKLEHILVIAFTITYLIVGTMNFHYKWFPIEYIQAIWILSLFIPLYVGGTFESKSKCNGNCNQGRNCNCKGK